MSKLNKEANITSGGFYHHFASKDDLLNETMQMYIFRYYSVVLDKINDCKGSHKELLKTVAFSMMGHGEHSKKVTMLSDGTKVDYRELHLLLLEGVKKFDAIHKQYETLLVKVLDVISNIIDDGKAQGTIRDDIDSQEVSLVIKSVISGTINLWIVLEDMNLEEKMDYAMDCIWDYMTK
ncbi:MAG: TetR/AcrR family transcriptional regulator [Methanobacterium paludis]|nr:TetR/AcrR family transcriptional regulator [Methanobacterium paludis]